MSSGYLYFTSKRDGNSDIFRIRLALPQPTELLVKGRVINKKTNETVSNTLIRYGAKGEPMNIITSENGFYELKIPKGLAFELMPQKAGFASSITDVMFRRDYYYFREQYVDVYVEPLEVDTKIELRPIYFAQSKSDILPTSYSELERLAGLLQENPGVCILVEGHTDNLGQSQDLIQLSDVRAQSIRDYLIKSGIDGARIQAKGFGPSEPLNDNSTDELRGMNRRVEVRVTKIK